jgi:hypothetical protein
MQYLSLCFRNGVASTSKYFTLVLPLVSLSEPRRMESSWTHGNATSFPLYALGQDTGRQHGQPGRRTSLRAILKFAAILLHIMQSCGAKTLKVGMAAIPRPADEHSK